jgi:hypothetical protein
MLFDDAANARGVAVEETERVDTLLQYLPDEYSVQKGMLQGANVILADVEHMLKQQEGAIEAKRQQELQAGVGTDSAAAFVVHGPLYAPPAWTPSQG